MAREIGVGTILIKDDALLPKGCGLKANLTCKDGKWSRISTEIDWIEP